MTASVASFADLLQSAVTEPGILSNCYRAFYGYSVGNQLLAWSQCIERGITPGPIATFMGWKDKGRHVRKGEKALTLCMPVTVKRKADDVDADDRPEMFTRFVYRPHWFVLAQTEGQPLADVALPTWDRSRALEALNVTEEPFAMLDGNCQGYARQRTIAVSPIAAMPFKTTFHEVAHVLLGHTTESEQADRETTPRSLKECEAECVAMLCCAALDLPGRRLLPWLHSILGGRRQPCTGAFGTTNLKSSRSDPEGWRRGRVMRAAIYARVSTLDQEPENQLAELRRFVEVRGWTATEYVDKGVSGAKDRRPALDQLVKDAKRRKLDVLVCWRLDRLGRNLKHLITLLDDMQALGVAFVSLA